jgi:chromate transporter
MTDEPTTAAVPKLSFIRMCYSFFRIGVLGFGGGMALIAMIEAEYVRRNRRIEPEEFIHGVGLGQILGPFAVNTSFFVGYRLHGLPGGIAAVISFMAPSVSIVIPLSWLYFAYRTIPSLQGPLNGLTPVVIALIVSATWSMRITAIRTRPAMLLAVLACLASLLHINSAWVLILAGMSGIAYRSRWKPGTAVGGALILPLLATGAPGLAATTSAAGVIGTAWTFLKIGCVFFGGGYVLLPMLHHQLVTDLGWLSQREFLDGVAISQLTPGPLAVLSTFCGYRGGGPLGAVVATAALFLPGLTLMYVLSHYYRRFRHNRKVRDFLAGVAPAVVGLVFAAALILAPSALLNDKPANHILFAICLFGLIKWKWHPAVVIFIGSLTGTLFPEWLA